MAQADSILEGPENCEMGQKAGSFYRQTVKNKVEKNRK